MSEAITLPWASIAPILIEPARGIPVTVTPVSTEPVSIWASPAFPDQWAAVLMKPLSPMASPARKRNGFSPCLKMSRSPICLTCHLSLKGRFCEPANKSVVCIPSCRQ